MSERLEAALAGELVDAMLEPRSADLLDAPAPLADEMVMMRRGARRVSNAPRTVLHPVDAREDAERHEQVQRPEHGCSADAAPLELRDDVLSGERLRAAQRGADHEGARRRAAAAIRAQTVEDGGRSCGGHFVETRYH
ncbi:MAG TPA: hypothetical protein VFV20_10325 [Candidatus Limnocylindria bacterium]|nr:hypothetical protein [Candidatus Limnocylindria bacterium]